jgi:hypothetical protein
MLHVLSSKSSSWQAETNETKHHTRSNKHKQQHAAAAGACMDSLLGCMLAIFVLSCCHVGHTSIKQVQESKHMAARTPPAQVDAAKAYYKLVEKDWPVPSIHGA